jgi:long-chain acyl-CoA synthetase
VSVYGQSTLALAGDDTFPRLLRRNARTWAGRTALREKKLGIWHPITWRKYLEEVRDLSLGFVGLGLKRGDKVAIVGDNRPQWLYAALAAQSVGAVSVGLYQDSNLNEIAFIIDHCDAAVVVVEDQEQVDKILGMIERLPQVRAIVYWDARGLRRYNHPLLIELSAVQASGRALGAEKPGLWDAHVDGGTADDLAIICYTSGTTGAPKGAMLTFANLLSMALRLSEVDPRHADDEFVSFLPLAWIGEQMMSVATALSTGFTVNFPEEPETQLENIREIGPHLLFGPPRFWEGLSTTVQVKIMDTTRFKRFMFERLMRVGTRVAELRFRRQPVSLAWRVVAALARLLLFAALKDRLGLSRLRSASTGGGALGPDVFRFFHAIGVPLRQLYGQTEISGISCIHRGDDILFHTVGVPIPGTEIRIADDGEVLSRSPAVFRGYYKNDAATLEALAGGWLHSGDAGAMTPEGHLEVFDRLKDVLRLADGTRFSPQHLENRLKFSPYIKEAMVVGKDRPFLTALVCIDGETVGKWADKHKLAYTTYTDLAGRNEVYDMIQRELDRVNQTLAGAACIRKFVLLYKELDADDEELTRTRKIRRALVEERYAEIISAMYRDDARIAIDTTIRFQDGKTAHIQTELSVRVLGAG